MESRVMAVLTVVQPLEVHFWAGREGCFSAVRVPASCPFATAARTEEMRAALRNILSDVAVAVFVELLVVDIERTVEGNASLYTLIGE